MRASRQALGAIATVDGRAGDDVVALFDRAHLGTDSLDNTVWFVAEDSRCACRQGTANAMKITMADAGRDSSHKDLARTRLVDLDFLDYERLIGFAQNGGFDLHGPLLS